MADDVPSQSSCVRRDPLPFTMPCALFVEGVDEVNFFKALLEHTDLDARHERVDLRDVGGKQKLRSSLPGQIVATGFRDVRCAGIVQDANGSVADTFKSICRTLRDNKLTPPDKQDAFGGGRPRIGVFVMPDNRSPGALETLCLASRIEHPMMKCVDAFVQCVEASRGTGGHETERGPKNTAKARALSYLAAMPDDVHSCGMAAQKGYWDLDHPCMQPVIQFLRDMLDAAGV